LASDIEVARYFRDHQVELDAITGAGITILIPKEIEANNTVDVVAALETGGAKRYPGLGYSDLPCLWIEDEFNRTAIVRLPTQISEVIQTMRGLADIVRKTKNAPEIREALSENRTSDFTARNPLAAIIERGITMNKSTERLIALIFGVIFVGAILVIAIFIPSPTPFQYTVFRIVLAVAAGGFVSMTPGFIEAKVGSLVRGGGALAVFVVVYFYAPAAIGALT